MTSAQVVETSVKVTTNSPFQDYTYLDDHNLLTYGLVFFCLLQTTLFQNMISRKTNQSSIFVNTTSYPLNTDLTKEAASFGPGKYAVTLTDVNGNYTLYPQGLETDVLSGT